MTSEEPYVLAPVPAIIANIDDAKIPVERDSDLTDEQKDAKARRGRAIHPATAAKFCAAETVERISYYELAVMRSIASSLNTANGSAGAMSLLFLLLLDIIITAICGGGGWSLVFVLALIFYYGFCPHSFQI